MAINQTASMSYQDALRSLARQLDAAGHGKKGTIKQSHIALYGISMQTLHRQLGAIGWSSNRKRRADAGTTSQDEAVLLELGATLQAGIRKNGKATMHTPTARSLLAQNGRQFTVSNGRLNHLLKQRHLDAAAQKQDAPHSKMRSLHPNHVHQVDPSLCLLYYAPNGEQRVGRSRFAEKNTGVYKQSHPNKIKM